MSTGGSSLQRREPERQINYKLLNNAEFKSEWMYTSTGTELLLLYFTYDLDTIQVYVRAWGGLELRK
jgi:hypothetical protein